MPIKNHKLNEAVRRLDSFNFIVDLAAVATFAVAAIATANKLMTNKIIMHEFFNLSWRTIALLFGIFLPRIHGSWNETPLRILLCVCNDDSILYDPFRKTAARNHCRHRCRN